MDDSEVKNFKAKQFRIDADKIFGACEALKEYGIGAQIAFPIKFHGINPDSVANTTAANPRIMAIDYLLENIPSTMERIIRNYVECYEWVETLYEEKTALAIEILELEKQIAELKKTNEK